MGRKLKLSNLIEQKRGKKDTHMVITCSSLICVKVGQKGKHLKQPGPYQRTMGKSEETGKARDEGDRAKPYCPFTRQIVEKTVKAPSRMKTVFIKANSRRKRNEPTQGMRKTGPSHTMPIIPKGMAEKLSEATSHTETMTGKDKGDRSKPHRLSTRKIDKLSRHTAALKQCPQKANCNRQANVKQSTPGMRETGPNHTMSIIP